MNINEMLKDTVITLNYYNVDDDVINLITSTIRKLQEENEKWSESNMELLRNEVKLQKRIEDLEKPQIWTTEDSI